MSVSPTCSRPTSRLSMGPTMPPSLPLPEFIRRWQGSALTERSAAQSHFIDLCDVLGQPRPAAADQAGAWYTFEKGVAKTGGGKGFADIWLRGRFAWEYKGPRKDLATAYQQLLQYREDLENPPLLVVCDLQRFEVHTNFTGTVKRVYAFALPDLVRPEPTPTSPLPPLEVLRALFEEPERLRPAQTSAQVTEAVAREFAQLAESLRRAGADPTDAAHFLMRLLFCLFAEDIGLLPSGLFTRLVERTLARPADFEGQVRELFRVMATGGWFGEHPIPRFDGGLFSGLDTRALALTFDDLKLLARVARFDWASVEPAIFGTLFERSLDPSKRAQIGAHYTSREDILRIVEPVLMAPLRRRWDAVRDQAEALIARREAASGAARTRQQQALQQLLTGFASEIAAVRVLDPACGSGNFLYVALKQLLDLEKEVILFAATSGLPMFFPQIGPEQLHGIEINAFAHELAQVVIWIGYIQWLHDNGFGRPESPILKPLETIAQLDAILARDESGRPIEAAWPEADVIIGNPPFLGGKRLRTELGDQYVEALFRLYEGRVPREADLVTYWFERARALLAAGAVKRAGLLATQGIRGGANRKVLGRIKQTGDIFLAWSDEPWVLEGAAVHVSLIGFDNGQESERTLDGRPVQTINPDLTGTLDLTAARRLPENVNLAYMGGTKGGPFDLSPEQALTMLTAPLNPNGRPNSDVVRPWVTGIDLTRRPRGYWIIDFGVNMPETEAALYEQPFEYVQRHVRPERLKNNRAAYRERWWLHMEPRPAMRRALAPLRRYIGTSMVAKHRIFVWLDPKTLPENLVIVVAREDDDFFGVLHSKPHELWARRMGTQLREAESGFRYTPTTTFETFPFPWPPGRESTDDPRVQAIAQAARELVEKRDRWLNPEGASETELKTRTLTALYNQRPTWLGLAHRQLDQAVLTAYGWPPDLSDEAILERLLALNSGRASIP